MFGKVMIFVNIESKLRPLTFSAEQGNGDARWGWEESGRGATSDVPRRSWSALVNLLGNTFGEVRVIFLNLPVLKLRRRCKCIWNPLHSFSQETLFTVLSQSDYPNLAKLAKHYLCIPGRSVAAVRMFSTAGSDVTSKMSRLSPEHVDQFAFQTQNWLFLSEDNDETATD